ncbi:MAG: putative DNA binding domain-containing protein [Selenomonadaceae bacterium]|nr:putative DNA binding domain-containing protein [Selenomonadaceae bacterium]
MTKLDPARFGEGEDLEYKVSEPKNRDKYLKTVVAFANGRGGKIIFGVADETLEVIGMPQDEIFAIMDAITNAIVDSCEPRIIPRISIMPVEDKSLIVVEIPSGMMPPYYIKSQGAIKGVYLRVAGTTRQAESYQVQELILTGSNRSFDQQVTEESITEDEVADFCSRLHAYGEKLRETDSNLSLIPLRRLTASQLIAWKLIQRQGDILRPTNGYLLLNGEVGDHFDEPYVQCAVFKGTTKANFITHREFHGPLYEQIEDAYNFVLQYIRVIPEIEGLVRRDFYEMPPRSIREAITNAVCHRSYLHPGQVQVALYDDRLEIISPGALTTEMTIEKMKRGVSIPRNKAIVEAFNYMGVIDKWGSGIPRLFNDAVAYGLPAPEMEDLDGQFIIWFPRRLDSATTQSTTQTDNKTDNKTDNNPLQTIKPDNKTDNKTDNKKMTDLLELLKANPTISQSKCAAHLGWSMSQVRYYIDLLRKQGMVRHIGSRKSGVWQIIAKEII